MSKCCEEAECHRRQPVLFTKTPVGRWLLVTRYQFLDDEGLASVAPTGNVKVLERHDVTAQIDTILMQYRLWLDDEMAKAVERANESELVVPKLILPTDFKASGS